MDSAKDFSAQYLITEHAISNTPHAALHSIEVAAWVSRVQAGQANIQATAIPGQGTRINVNMQKGCIRAE